MGINQAIATLTRDIVEAVNRANLPASVVELVLKNFLNTVQQAAAEDLAAEQCTEQEATNG